VAEPPRDRDSLLNALILALKSERKLGMDCLPVPQQGGAPSGDTTGRLQEMAEIVSRCTSCTLCRSRTRTVFGEGSPAPRLMFIGEGPGVEEDRCGRPFVGPAGRLLDRIIKAAMLEREEVYIANIVKCHPPGNRTPDPAEVETCLPFLKEQIRLLNPEVICPLGSPATRTILNANQGIMRLRGRRYPWPDNPEITVIPTFHPAYLLRNPHEKGKTWSDIQMIMKILGIEIPNHR